MSNINENKWKTTKKLGRDCPKCGKAGTCTITDDGLAGHCFKGTGTWTTPRGDKPGLSDEQSRDYFKALTPPQAKPTPAKSFTSPQSLYESEAKRRDGELFKIWPYIDAKGTTVMTVGRINLPDGGKDILPATPTPTGWILRKPKGRTPLFNLQAVMDSNLVIVVEGEKCADVVSELEYVGTTSQGGAGNAKGSDWGPLAGKSVVVIPDFGPTGQKYADDVVRLIRKLDPPPRIKVIDLPDLSDGEDIVEWVANEREAGRDPANELLGLIDAAPECQGRTGAVLKPLSDVVKTDIQWAWPGRIPLGRLSLLAGKPGRGKSFLTLDWAARLSTGTDWPDGSPCKRCEVLLVSGEDDAGDTIRPRLEACGGDPTRVHFLTGLHRRNDDGKLMEVPFTLEAVDELDDELKARPGIRLVIIDPIGSVMGGKVDSHRDTEVRALLAPLAALAARRGVAILLVAHRRKDSGGGADESILGSVGFVGICRVVMHVADDEKVKGRRLLTMGKCNIGPPLDGLAFTIEGTPPRVVYEPEPVTQDADEALGNERASQQTGRPPDERREVMRWMDDRLGDGPVEVAIIKREAREAGFSWATVRRAKVELSVKCNKNTYTGKYEWRLPNTEQAGQNFPRPHTFEQAEQPSKSLAI